MGRTGKESHLRSQTTRAFALGLLLGLGASMTPGCTGKGGTDGGAGGLLPNGAPCQFDRDCQSDVCASDSTGALKFCTVTCLTTSECPAKDFPQGCCFPIQAGLGLCALHQLCQSQGDAGLGEPCPNHTECNPDLVCLFSQDNTINECSRPCDSKHGCGNISQECCEPLSGDTNLWCVIDNTCAATSGSTGTTGTTGTSGTTGTTGASGTSGSTSGDAGPVTFTLSVDGQVTGTAHSYAASVTLNGGLLTVPQPAGNVQLQVPPGLQPGHYGCDADAGGTAAPTDGGVGPYASVYTGSQGNSPGFVDALPLTWQGLTLGTACGAGHVGGMPSASLDAFSLDITAYTPGRLRSSDGGYARGHLTGTCQWEVSSGASTFTVQGSFDVDLLPP